MKFQSALIDCRELYALVTLQETLKYHISVISRGAQSAPKRHWNSLFWTAPVVYSWRSMIMMCFAAIMTNSYCHSCGHGVTKNIRRCIFMAYKILVDPTKKWWGGSIFDQDPTKNTLDFKVFTVKVGRINCQLFFSWLLRLDLHHLPQQTPHAWLHAYTLSTSSSCGQDY